jgi:acetylornithine deacetylase
LIALTSDVHEVELALVGHTDTVPYDPNWSEATNLTERDGKLYGRGACDTKGFIAAALTAVENVKPKSHSRSYSQPTKKSDCVARRSSPRQAAACSLQHRRRTTSLKPIRAGKGYSLAEVIVKGREAHSAYPALGASAVFRAARLINRLESIATQLKQDQHAAFDPPYTTLNVGLIHGGSAKNVLAGECGSHSSGGQYRRNLQNTCSIFSTRRSPKR